MDGIGNQSGSWTISWQGASGPITTRETILQAIRSAVSSGTAIASSVDGTGVEGADAAIVVVGETPYAEGWGDRSDVSLRNEDVVAVARAKAVGIPMVLVSGRPLIIDPILGVADAVVATWLPRSEGGGVDNVLLGTTGRPESSLIPATGHVPNSGQRGGWKL